MTQKDAKRDTSLLHHVERSGFMRISNIKIYEDITEEELLKRVCKKNKINQAEISSWKIFKKSIDARDKKDVHYNYTIDIFKVGEAIPEEDLLTVENPRLLSKRPVVIGAGPAGLFAAYTLALNGAKPILLEQGKCVEDRQKDVENFMNQGVLIPNSNVQFGEGGAGTFSDGKLTTGVNNPLNRTVLQTFVKFGAPEQIMYLNKPHIGTDHLIHVVKNMREEIKCLGGTALFETKVVGIELMDALKENTMEKKIASVILENGQKIETEMVILAIGHSARDTFEELYAKGIKFEPKPFSVGVRIEHKQEMINKSQYGTDTKLNLPPAEYKLVYHAEDGRTCYTFCMCPGGTVMASSSEEGTIVTNGMSKFARDGENANSAVLVNVTPEDCVGDTPLKGIYFQKKLEEEAFRLAGSNYYAPIQRVEDFIHNRKSEKIGEIKPSYRPGVSFTNLNDIFPEFVSRTMKEGILYFDKKLKGFANPDAIMTGVETRSSSPVRIPRDENLEANVKGIYPCGEGAGYAGGIMTAAMDGIKVAKKILEM
ncbi:MAG: FAD-binding protein [Clostridia bacterium]|nr:FAD-binding protein [Clostridia bacterium]